MNHLCYLACYSIEWMSVLTAQNYLLCVWKVTFNWEFWFFFFSTSGSPAGAGSGVWDPGWEGLKGLEGPETASGRGCEPTSRRWRSQALFLLQLPGCQLWVQAFPVFGIRQEVWQRYSWGLRLSCHSPSTERFYLEWQKEFGRQTVLASNPIPSFNWLHDRDKLLYVLWTVCWEKEGKEGRRKSRSADNRWSHCTRPELELQTLVEWFPVLCRKNKPNSKFIIRFAWDDAWKAVSRTLGTLWAA